MSGIRHIRVEENKEGMMETHRKKPAMEQQVRCPKEPCTILHAERNATSTHIYPSPFSRFVLMSNITTIFFPACWSALSLTEPSQEMSCPRHQHYISIIYVCI